MLFIYIRRRIVDALLSVEKIHIIYMHNYRISIHIQKLFVQIYIRLIDFNILRNDPWMWWYLYQIITSLIQNHTTQVLLWWLRAIFLQVQWSHINNHVVTTSLYYHYSAQGIEQHYISPYACYKANPEKILHLSNLIMKKYAWII